MSEKGIFSLFRKKEDEDLEKAEARIEKPEDKISEKAREEAREYIRDRDELKKAAKEAKKVKKHVVVSGDTLSGIAKKYYDNAGKYMKIYEANKDVIGDDPNLIQPGMELVIPEL